MMNSQRQELNDTPVKYPHILKYCDASESLDGPHQNMQNKVYKRLLHADVNGKSVA